MALGLRDAGFDCLFACDLNPDAVKTVRQVVPLAEAFELTRESAAEIAARFQVPIDLLAGGVPCQPFSAAGKHQGEWDQRDGFPAFLALAAALQPRALVIENVKGLTTKPHRGYLDRVVAEIEGLGYVVRWRVLNAADFGVPQRRERIFIVGLEPGSANRFAWPAPTHSEAALVWAKYGNTGVKRGGVVGGSYWSDLPAPALPIARNTALHHGLEIVEEHSVSKVIRDESRDQFNPKHLRSAQGASGRALTVRGVRPGGGKDDPKHSVKSPDSPYCTVRVGNHGSCAEYVEGFYHPTGAGWQEEEEVAPDVPPVYAQGITRNPSASGGVQIYSARTRSKQLKLEGRSIDCESVAISGAHSEGSRRWVECSQRTPHLNENGKEASTLGTKPTTRDLRLLAKIKAGTLEVVGEPWVTVRQAIGDLTVIGLQAQTHGGGQATSFRSGDEPTWSIRQHGSGSGPGVHLTVIGAGGNPHGQNREAERNRRDITDEAAPTMAAEQIGNRGPWVSGHEELPRLRRLTPRERARLQDFPDDHVFVGNKTSVYQQVGNACPPRLAEVVGAAIAAVL
jgi:site-specific DNA-cytosine methylase